MPFADHFLTGREKTINWILKIDPAMTLNSPGTSPIQRSGGNSLAGKLKETLNQIKSLALSTNGKVDYKKLADDPIYHAYRELAAELRGFDYRSLKAYEEKLAFWINLYNAMVIDAVIQENVRKSVTESRLGIMAFFQRAAYQVNHQRFSLTDIEHGLLRANRGFPYFPGPHFSSSDPRLEAAVQPFEIRIHFALNCASNSCPPIGVYTPDKIEAQLDLAARNFINSDLDLNPNQKEVSISRIFNWYRGDFGGDEGILSFLIPYIADPDISTWISRNQAAIKIKYHPYDWGLNKING
jgi:hypothetical protein